MNNSVGRAPVGEHLRELGAHRQVSVFIPGSEGEFAPGFMVIATGGFRNAELNSIAVYAEIFFAVAVCGFHKRSFADKTFGKNINAPMLTDNVAKPAAARIAKIFFHPVFWKIKMIDSQVVCAIKVFIQKNEFEMMRCSIR